MALRVTNTTKGKVIGLGTEVILPGESKVIQGDFVNNPMLDFYKEKGFVLTAKVSDKNAAKKKGRKAQSSDSSKTATPDEVSKDALETEDAGEALRKARLASLKSITDDALGKLAQELGINPADCKDIADMKKKVREALKA